jgi:IS5 family transposase
VRRLPNPLFARDRGASSSVDPDAAWTRKGGRSYFGYKAHVCTDQGSGLIRKAILTPARINESSVADDLIMGDEQAIYADKGYENKHRRKRLKAAGIKDRIMHRSHKHQKQLPHWQQQRNRLIIPIRSPVEQVFGLMKRSYGYTRVRYFSLARNTLQLNLLCMAINMRKAITLL